MTQPIREFDVVIIGAGWSGLMACKYCLAEGIRPIVLESRDRAGGVWSYTDDLRYAGVMKTTRTTSSRCLTEISDFPMPPGFPDFPSHHQINSYLDTYSKQFSLGEHIAFNQHVERIAKHADRWHITAGDTVWSASQVIVASGVHRYPNNVSNDLRFHGYSGTVLHSAAVKDIGSSYAGKTVLVWGGGESASDIANELAGIASGLYWCIPNGQWFVPRVVDRWPPFPSARRKIVDHTTSRVRLFLSPTHQYSPFIYQYLEYAFGFNGHGQPAWRTAAPYNRSFFNKSSEVLDQVRRGRVRPKRDIVQCEGKIVTFTDGTSDVVDCIVICSGYRTQFPFFDESTDPGNDSRKWFKHIFFNDDPSLAFVGFVRPIFGSIPGIAELQSRYVAKVFSGRCRLPDLARRSATIDHDTRIWDRHFRFTSGRLAGLVDHYVYCNQIARLIGCYPNFRALLFSSPRRWWHAVIAPWNGCQFWLNDPQHHDRIFATFRHYDENRISQNYIFLALAPVLPFIGLCTHLRVLLRGQFGDRRRFVADRGVRCRPVLEPECSSTSDRQRNDRNQGVKVMVGTTVHGSRSVSNSAAACDAIVADPTLAYPPCNDHRDIVPGESGTLLLNAQTQRTWVPSVQVVARIVEMLSGQRSRLEADQYIDPEITIHMDAAVHRGLILWQKWLYLIRNCGRIRSLRLLAQEISADPRDPGIVNLVGRWAGIDKRNGMPREASHLAHFRYRLVGNRVVELWTRKTNYDFIIGNWIGSGILYRLYLGWAIPLFWRLDRHKIDYRIDKLG